MINEKRPLCVRTAVREADGFFCNFTFSTAGPSTAGEVLLLSINPKLDASALYSVLLRDGVNLYHLLGEMVV